MTAEQLPYRVADLSLAAFGRKEIQLAEHEMPGLMSTREEFAASQPLKGARITGTVLFSIHTLGAIGVLGHSGLGLAKVLTVISWLIACGAVVFLWQRSSSEYFRAPAR